MKQDVCLHDFREHSKVSIFCSLFFFVDSFNQIRHQLLTFMFLLGDIYHQMESNWRWYEQSESTVVAGKVCYLLLRSYLQYYFTCGGSTRFLIEIIDFVLLCVCVVLHLSLP